MDPCPHSKQVAPFRTRHTWRDLEQHLRRFDRQIKRGQSGDRKRRHPQKRDARIVDRRKGKPPHNHNHRRPHCPRALNARHHRRNEHRRNISDGFNLISVNRFDPLSKGRFFDRRTVGGKAEPEPLGGIGIGNLEQDRREGSKPRSLKGLFQKASFSPRAPAGTSPAHRPHIGAPLLHLVLHPATRVKIYPSGYNALSIRMDSLSIHVFSPMVRLSFTHSSSN